MPFTIAASAVDPTYLARTALSGVDNMHVPIWRIGTDLYVMCVVQLAAGASNSEIAIYKSTDDGVTWTVQDATNQPPNSAVANNFLSGTTLYVLVGAQVDQTDVALRLYSFDCTNDTWTSINSSGPSAHWPAFIGRLSTGDIVIAYGTFGSSDLILASFSGSTWATIQNLSTLLSANLNQGYVYGDVDQDDWTHICFRTTAGSLPHWHASVDSSLAMGTTELLGTSGSFALGGVLAMGDYVLVAMRNGENAQVVSGTPLTAPVFTLSDTIDATTKPDFPSLAYEPVTGKLIIYYGDYNTEETFWFASTLDLTGLSGWSAPEKLYDVNSDTLPPDFNTGAPYCWPAQIWADGGSFWTASNYINTANGSEASFLIGRFDFTLSVPFRNTFE